MSVFGERILCVNIYFASLVRIAAGPVVSSNMCLIYLMVSIYWCQGINGISEKIMFVEF